VHMIPFRAPMPPSISDPSTEPAETSFRRTIWPADYYAGATPEAVLPRWTAYGCGAASVLILIVVFAGGVYLSGGGMAQLMDFSFGMTLGEMRGMYTPEVTKAQKDTLEKEIETMRANVRDGKTSVNNLQPVLQAIQKAIKDEKLTPAEVDQLTAATRKTAPKPR